MEDFKSAIFVLMGFLIGAATSSNVVNSDCAKYGSYVTSKYKMTCEARK